MSKLLKIFGHTILAVVLFAILFGILRSIGATDDGSGIVAALISLISSALKSKLSSLKNELDTKTEKAEELGKRLAGPRFSLPEKAKEKYVRVAIAGLGGTGKTSLIRHISGCRSADPRMKTGFARTYSIVREVAYEEKTEVYRIDLEDYRGQNVSELLTNIQSSDGKRFPVTAIVMLVDLFETDPEHYLPNPDNGILWDEARVNKHLREWSDQLIGALLTATPDVKYICLFINKVDLVNAPMGSQDREIKKLFSAIISSFKSRGSDKLIKVIVGSVADDYKINTLITDLMEEASIVIL